MIDPRTIYIIHKEREAKLMQQIEGNRAAQERWEYADTRQPWYSAVEQWLKEKVFSRSSANRDCCPEEGAA